MTIREHPLAWRWTDPNHAVLPEEVLDQMVSFAPEKAGELFIRACSLNGNDGLSSDQFVVRVISTGILGPETGRDWLRSQQPDLPTKIILSWGQDTAIMTTWEIFTEYWSDFCYGGSDDLNVWPEDEQWALLFHHDDEFHFGRQKRS